MVPVLRYTGMRISDVVTLSREHIQNGRIVKRAIKNKRLIRVDLPAVVIEALNTLPHPKNAARDSKPFLASGSASVRSLVKGAERTLHPFFSIEMVAAISILPPSSAVITPSGLPNCRPVKIALFGKFTTQNWRRLKEP
jgi:hypothetical protein